MFYFAVTKCEQMFKLQWTKLMCFKKFARIPSNVYRSLLNKAGLDGRGLSMCWNPDCQCRRLLPKFRRLPFSGFLPLDVSSPAVGDILRSGRCRCVRCSLWLLMEEVYVSSFQAWLSEPIPPGEHASRTWKWIREPKLVVLEKKEWRFKFNLSSKFLKLGTNNIHYTWLILWAIYFPNRITILWLSIEDMSLRGWNSDHFGQNNFFILFNRVTMGQTDMGADGHSLISLKLLIPLPTNQAVILKLIDAYVWTFGWKSPF